MGEKEDCALFSFPIQFPRKKEERGEILLVIPSAAGDRRQ